MLSLYAWSLEHITQVFEAKTYTECQRALDETFSQRVEFTMNGTPLPRAGLLKTVLSMVESSGYRLRVDWKNAVEVPRDPENRSGVLGGYYVIRNIAKAQPGSLRPVLCERHKSINVVIESELPDSDVDSRRIVKLALIATDVPMQA